MKILYDLIATQPIGNVKYHGAGEYAKIIFKKLVSNKTKCDVTCFYNENIEIDSGILEIVKLYKVNIISVTERSDIKSIIEENKFDKLFSALPFGFRQGFKKIDFGRTEFIFTIHGLRPIEMPTDRYEPCFSNNIVRHTEYILKKLFKNKFISLRKKHLFESINMAENKKIIVPSLHTKYSIMQYFPGISENNIFTFYSPQEETVEPVSNDELIKYKCKKKMYFLLVSSNVWIKNCVRAILALDQIFTEFPNIRHKVILTGLTNDEASRTLKRRILNIDRFNFIGYVDRSVLEMLYENAYCFIYPSLNEGFGYPPLASMKYGTPVICSAITSIPEICKDGVLYFNPFSIEEMKGRILQLLFDVDSYGYYSYRGQEIYEVVSSKQKEALDGVINLILQ